MNRRRAAAGLALATFAIVWSTSLCQDWIRDPFAFRRFQAGRLGAEFQDLEGVVLQRRLNDCGPAALAMVLRRFGLSPSLDEISRLAGLGQRGVSMATLLRVARLYGIEGQALLLKSEDLRRLNGPAIAFLKRGHFVVVDRPQGDRLTLLDPSLGRLRISKRRFRRLWNGEALVFPRSPHSPKPPGATGALVPSTTLSHSSAGDRKGGE